LLRGKNGKALINLRKPENDDIDDLKVRSTRNPKSLLECHTITALVATFDVKALNHTELLKPYLAGGNRIINFLRQTNRKGHGLLFYKFHICFFLSVLKKKQTHYSHVRRRKDVKAQREDYVATRLPRL